MFLCNSRLVTVVQDLLSQTQHLEKARSSTETEILALRAACAEAAKQDIVLRCQLEVSADVRVILCHLCEDPGVRRRSYNKIVVT